MHPISHAAITPGKPACIMARSGAQLTYAELDARADQGARLFRGLGLNRGDVVAVMLTNGFDMFEIAWATQRAGLYLTCVSTSASASDLAYILQDSGARILVASNEYEGVAATALAASQAQGFLASHAAGTLPNWRDTRGVMPAGPIPDPLPGADMLYSSGTTGRPKGVKPPLPDGALDAPTPLTAMGQSLYAMGPDMRYLSTSPLYHAAPLRWAMTVHRLGGSVVIMEQFDAASALGLIEDHAITHATWVPTHFVRMLKLPDDIRARHDYRSLRAVIHAAAPCPVAVKQAMIDWWGPIVHEYYSGTEGCGITALSSAEWLAHPGSVGRAVLGTPHIVDDGGVELAAGLTGNVWFEGGLQFEYHNDPAKTAEAHDHRGWATMGDIGRLDADGYLYLSDRKSFMIISGGVNIYPQEIENLLVTHPRVADAAVFGVPDEEMGERVVAVVEPADRADAGDDFAGELSRFVRAALGAIKAPKHIAVAEKLPREPTGKLLKRKLQVRYRDAGR